MSGPAREEDDDRTLFVDASVYIRLATVGASDLLPALSGRVVVPDAVEAEIVEPPAREKLADALDEGTIEPTSASEKRVANAAAHLGCAVETTDALAGDVALLACAFEADAPVVLSDDQAVRKTCRALSIPISGSIGVLVRSVETGTIDPDRAGDHLHAMDGVGARLSASLVREAERLIDEAVAY